MIPFSHTKLLPVLFFLYYSTWWAPAAKRHFILVERWPRTGCRRSLVKHALVRVLEEIHVVLNALFVALWLVQAELQVFHTHLKLLFSLKVHTDTDDDDCYPSTQNAPAAPRWTHNQLALAEKSELIVFSVDLSFQLQDFALQRLVSGISLVFHLADLHVCRKHTTDGEFL